jgi:hypothetical protein
MISARLVELIEIHASRLTTDATDDLLTNERTPSFRAVVRKDLEERVFNLYHHLGNWIGDPNDDAVRAEFEEWGRRRFRQRIPLSEIVFAIVLVKKHLRRYIRDHGIVDAGTESASVEGDYLLPMHLHSVQELNFMVGEFFDKALYYLARGFEAEGGRT